MRACVMVEPQHGMTYDDLLRVARTALDAGLDGIFRSDHYERPRNGKPAMDAWASLAGLVRDLDHGVVGTLVSPVTFRHPGELAKVVSTVRHMSRGPTVELGLGTGWHEAEHKAFGFWFGTRDERFRVLGEYLPLVRKLLSGEEFSFAGKRYTVEGGGNLPAAPDVRIIVGGSGPSRTPRLAALHADELNLVMLPPAQVAERVKTCREQLERAGRDPGAFAFSWMGQFLIGSDQADLERRAEGTGRLFAGRSGADLVAMMRNRIPCGTVLQAAEFIGHLAEAGIGRVMLQHLTFADDEHLKLAAEAVRAAS